MDTSEEFDALSDNIKDCQNEETIEDCVSRNLVNGVQANCKCLPIDLIDFRLDNQVSLIKCQLCHY